MERELAAAAGTMGHRMEGSIGNGLDYSRRKTGIGVPRKKKKRTYLGGKTKQKNSKTNRKKMKLRVFTTSPKVYLYLQPTTPKKHPKNSLHRTTEP